MILIENIQVVGFEPTIRGMRNPMNSWDKSDSKFAEMNCDHIHDIPGNNWWFGELEGDAEIGPNDHDLMLRLAKQGPVHGKFRRMIVAYMDITAPLYWWKEFDTYKVGTVANSCSTMHKIHAKEFTLDDFSHEHLGEPAVRCLLKTIKLMNAYRECFIHYEEPHDPPHKLSKKDYWWQMIQLLPSSYNQRRTVMLSYEVLANIRQYRGNHKLDEWREFCRVIDNLPYSEIITCSLKDEDKEK